MLQIPSPATLSFTIEKNERNDFALKRCSTDLSSRGVRSRGAQCAYSPLVLKQVGHMPPCEYAPPEI